MAPLCDEVVTKPGRNRVTPLGMAGYTLSLAVSSKQSWNVK